MMTAYSIPSLKTIGVLSGGAIAALIAAAWLIVTGDADDAIYSYLPLLGGMVLLMIALALFALRVINQRLSPPQS